MSIRFKTEKNQLLCTFTRDVVASAISQMRDLFNATLDSQTGWDTLVLDMEKVEKVDSLGINLIVWLFRYVKGDDHDFKIINCNDSLMKVFTLFRLQDQFTITPINNE